MAMSLGIRFPKLGAKDVTFPSDYGWGQIILPADAPEPTQAEREAERKADQIEQADLRKTFHWDDADFELALAQGMPTSHASATDRFGRRTYFYSRAATARWADRIVTLAATLQRGKL